MSLPHKEVALFLKAIKHMRVVCHLRKIITAKSDGYMKFHFIYKDSINEFVVETVLSS